MSFKLSHKLYVIFLIGMLAICLVISSGGSTAFAQSGDSGHWKQVKVTNFGQDKNAITPRLKTRATYQCTSRDGYVSAHYTSYFDSSHKTLVSERAGFVKWTPPPKVANPGQKWNGHYSATIQKCFNRTAQHMGYSATATLEIDASWRGVSSTSQKYSAYYSQKVGVFTTNDKKKQNVKKTSVMVFPTRKQAGHKDYLVIAVGARLSIGNGGDTYNYFYQWVPDKPREVTGHFRIVTKNNYGGIVKGLCVKVKNLENGKVKTMVTDKNGWCKESFTGKNGKVPLMVTEIAITKKTGYSILMEKSSPSYMHPNTTISYPMSKRFELSDTNKFMATYNLSVPIYKLIFVTSKWNDEKKKWVQCPTNLLIKRKSGKYLFRISKNSFVKKGDKYEFNFYIPAREIIKEKTITIFAYEPEDKKTAQVSFNVPSYKSKAKPYVISIQLTNTAEKIARTKYKVYRYFLPIVGEEKARLIANVKIELDNNRGKPCYLDGVMYIPGNFDLTRDEFSETFMHEWTHHIMEVLAKDPDIEDKLGGSHDIWVKAPTSELAWDEGRAHFFSVLLTRGLKMPYNPTSFSPKKAESIARAKPNSGDCVEGVVTAALIDYYSSAGYRKSKDVVGNFLQMSELSKKMLGHPPRTSAEFFKVMSQDLKNRENEGKITPGQSQKLLRVLNNVKSKYGISN